MLGFDNCCCGCIQWEQDFTTQKNVDNWTIESGTYSLTDYGLYVSGPNFSMLCDRECSDDIAFIDAVFNYNIWVGAGPRSRGIKIGGWTASETALTDGDGVLRGYANIPPLSQYQGDLSYRTLRFYADGVNVSNGRCYVPGIPGDKTIRVLIDNSDENFNYLTKVILYRKQSNGTICQNLLSIAANRLTPLKVQSEISGIAAGSSPGSYPTTGLNGTYLTASLTGHGYASYLGNRQWWPCAWSIASTTVAGGITYNVTTTVTASSDGGMTCTQTVASGGTTYWTLQWAGTAGTDLDSLTGMSGLALSSPTVTYEHYSLAGQVNGVILSLGSSACTLTAVL